MRRNRFDKTVLFGIAIFISTSFINAQGGQLLTNYSFEQKEPLAEYPTDCLDPISYSTDYFDRILNWNSFYFTDPPTCNAPFFVDYYTHSPDWVGGLPNYCLNGWDGNFSAGISKYENGWQQFNGGLDDEKCYEIRLKVSYVYPEQANNKLDVILSTTALAYQENLIGKPIGSDECEYCNLDYRTYVIGAFEDYKVLKRFSIDDITMIGSNPIGINPYYSYSYGNWFEFHGKIKMADINWNPAIPLDPEFVIFTLDLRDDDIMNGNCSGEYAIVDWVEFFESCPQKYDIHAAIIAGIQDEYIADEYIRAGNLGKGNSIIASNGRTSFKAKNYVELVPGFLSDYGSVLEIIPNVDCEGCSRPKYLSMPNQSGLSNSQIDNSNITKVKQNTRDCYVYPNPTAGFCSVIVLNGVINSLEIFDSKSQQIYLIENINKNQYELDISNLESGVYYVYVRTSENEIYHRKVIKI